MPMQSRRAHIKNLTGLAMLAVLPCPASESVHVDDSRILNRLMLHLLGLEETGLILEPALKGLSRLTPFVDPGRLAAFLRSRYHSVTGIDYDRFLTDIDQGKHPDIEFLVEIIRTEAMLAYYSSEQGWRETGYGGVPVGGAELPLSLH